MIYLSCESIRIGSTLDRHQFSSSLCLFRMLVAGVNAGALVGKGLNVGPNGANRFQVKKSSQVNWSDEKYDDAKRREGRREERKTEEERRKGKRRG